MRQIFDNVYENMTVLVTGHTGFKGSWLVEWLLELGANVVGFSLPELPTEPNNYTACRLAERITDVRGDIRNFETVKGVIGDFRPKIIFHLAAQPIVLHAIRDPKTTFETNAGGTINILEAIRQTNCVRALVSVTTDKVYANREWLWGYRENDQLGGSDPYSASKATAELAISSYRESYFPLNLYDQHRVAVASVRAGNVIGGGDFADYRLVPDCMKALMNGDPIEIRNPHSIRPWQHVLVPLSGYLWLGAKLLGKNGADYADAWNFGPVEQKGIPAQMLTEKLIELWGSGEWHLTNPDLPKVETGQLRLSWDQAATRLNWQPVYNWVDALVEITTWFKAFQADADIAAITRQHIAAYVQAAQAQEVAWSR